MLHVGEELGNLIRPTLDSLLLFLLSIPQLEITVLDVNDHPPVFSEQHYRAEVSENAEVGAEIITLNATDADQDKRVFYALHAASSASSLRKFKVDSVRGVVTLAEKLDR